MSWFRGRLLAYVMYVHGVCQVESSMACVFKLALESIDRVESVVWVKSGHRVSSGKSVRSTWSSAYVCMHSILELHSRLLLNSTAACRGVLL
jgi:hypothetical protein